MKKDIQSETAMLRKKAEELIKGNLSKSGSQLSEAELQKLIHELEVNQIELEIQNEEVLLSKNQTELATEKYTELYDLAPSGYFTLSEKGNIIDLNPSGSEMLGKERSRIKNRQFDFFVSNDTKPIFNLFIEKVFNSKAKETCEVTLSTIGNLPMYVQLTGIAIKNREQCLVPIIEIIERKHADELIIANKELAFQNDEKEKRAAELIIANKELDFQNNEKNKRADELIIANKELAFQNGEKGKRAAELVIADKELAFQNEEKGKRADELDITNKKLIKAHVEILELNATLEVKVEKRTAELAFANKELAFQNREKEKRTDELIIANEAILQSEKNFRRSISESPMGIRIVSVNGKTIYANKVFLDIYEFNSSEEFTSTPAINRYTPESYAQHQERKEKRKNGHDVFDYEISIVRKNAEIRHIKVSRKGVL